MKNSEPTVNKEQKLAHGVHDPKAQWDAARRLVVPLGKVPAFFSVPIRALMLDQRSGKGLRPTSQLMVARLMRSPTIKAFIYFAALTFHGDRLNNSAYLTSAEIIRTFTPDELAVLIGLVFITGRMGKAGKLGEHPEWLALFDSAMLRGEAGGYLGYAIPSLGTLRGLVVGCMPSLAQGLFLIADRKGMASYRLHLKKKKLRVDLEFEMNFWQCTHLHIGANLLQLLGFGIPLSHDFLTGLDHAKPVDPEKDPSAYEMSIVDTWIDALIETGAKPKGVHLGKYYPLERDAHKLLYEIDRLRREGSRHRWLKRCRNDINPHDTPQLFQEFLQELQQSKALLAFYEEHLPPELLESLSKEDLDEISAVERPEDI